jgi:hypothetical protein
LRFSKTALWHYGAKPLKFGEQSYIFSFFFSNLKVPLCFGNVCLLKLAAAAGRARLPLYLLLPSDRLAKKHAKMMEQSYGYAYVFVCFFVLCRPHKNMKPILRDPLASLRA